MTMLSSKSKKIAAAVLAAATFGVALAPTGASAGGGGHHGFGYGHGYGAAALGGGLLLGALAASSAHSAPAYARDCWLERRKRYDRYGYPFFVKVRVCD